jgi:hypothetical protein
MDEPAGAFYQCYDGVASLGGRKDGTVIRHIATQNGREDPEGCAPISPSSNVTAHVFRLQFRNYGSLEILKTLWRGPIVSSRRRHRISASAPALVNRIRANTHKREEGYREHRPVRRRRVLTRDAAPGKEQETPFKGLLTGRASWVQALKNRKPDRIHRR